MSESNWIAGEKLRAQAIERTRDQLENPKSYVPPRAHQPGGSRYMAKDITKDAESNLRKLESIGMRTFDAQKGGQASIGRNLPPLRRGEVFDE